jgi:DNA polymerase-3 subunit epsilon
MKALNFVALDVETANADASTICQIGIVTFTNGAVDDTWSTLIDPEADFDPFNVGIHGIDADDVQQGSALPGVASEITRRIANRIVVAHTGFDKAALSRAYQKYGLNMPDCQWLDSARVARQAWTQFRKRGYGLANLARWCGIVFAHHDAAEDARAAGLVLVKAVHDTGVPIDGWCDRQRAGRSWERTRRRKTRTSIPNPEGPLCGQTLVFTGVLAISRGDAMDYASAVGCAVASRVTDETTILVVGSPDSRTLASRHEKSIKQRRAEALNSAGGNIRIIDESVFQDLVGYDEAAP